MGKGKWESGGEETVRVKPEKHQTEPNTPFRNHTHCSKRNELKGTTAPVDGYMADLLDLLLFELDPTTGKPFDDEKVCLRGVRKGGSRLRELD